MITKINLEDLPSYYLPNEEKILELNNLIVLEELKEQYNFKHFKVGNNEKIF